MFHNPMTPTKAPMPVHNDSSEDEHEKRTSDHWGRFSGDFTTPRGPSLELSRQSIQRQRPSVAELRKSFEQNIGQESSSFLPQTPKKTSMKTAKSVQCSNQESRELGWSSSSLRRSKSFRRHSLNQQASSIFATPPSAKGRTHRKEPKDKNSEQSKQFSPTLLASNTHWDDASVSLTGDQLFRKENERVETITARTSLSGAGPVDVRSVESAIKKVDAPQPLAKSTEALHQKTLPKSKSGDSFFARMNRSNQGPMVRKPTKLQKPMIPVQVSPVPEPTFKSDVPPRRIGKVADLRKLFDRPFNRGSSPGPSIPFSQQRHRSETDVKSSNISESDGQSGLPASHSTKTCAPSLTTEISMNDFLCNFSERLVDSRAISAHLGANNFSLQELGALESSESPEMPIEPESPVKGRIRHFESLEQVASAKKSLSSNANLRVAFQQDDNIANKGGASGGWRPMRERGARMWRRISQNFSHSLAHDTDDSYDSDDSSLHAGNADTGRSPSSMSGVIFRARHSGFFGHRLSRTYDRRSSTAFSSRRSSSVDAGIGETLVATADHSVPYLNHNRRLRRSPPPSLPQQRAFPRLSFPSLEDVSNTGDKTSIDFATGMGLDGNVESRHKHADDSRAEPEAEVSLNNRSYHSPTSHLRYTSPRPAINHGDSSALSKVRSQQTSSREMRRRSRYDEKKRRRELKADAKQFQREQQHDERARSSTFESPLNTLSLPLPLPSIHHRNKNKGKQPATDAIPEEHISGHYERRTDTPTSRATAEAASTTEGQHDKKGKKKKRKDRSWGKKTESGFVVRHAEIEQIRQPKPRRPGQVKKLVNFYKERTSSSGVLVKLGKNANAGEGSTTMG
ncbi:hypothetical protein SLS62_003140 [Diatrype stigma]|uniref:Uncharacterized protein n=1 Tax=Diatrype stigma TaxID=117547 RepID=A0AAN9UVP6_9PEZI